MIENLTAQALSSNNFLAINKTLIKKVGLKKAAIISNLVDKHSYFANRCPDNDGWFYLTFEQQCEQLGVKEDAVRKTKQFLESKSILESKSVGYPAKIWYKINFSELAKLINEIPDSKTPDPEKIRGLDPEKIRGLVYKGELKKETLKETSKEVRSDSDESPNNNIEKWVYNKLNDSDSYIPPIVRTRKAPVIEIKNQKPPKVFITERWKKSVLDIWNKIPQTSSHKELTTKTAQKIDLYLTYLSSGLYWDRCKLKPDFATRNKIPLDSNWKSKCMIGRTAIIDIVKMYENLWKEGYWPTDKSHLPKSLSDFLYNPKTGTSFFLMLFYNPDISKPLVDRNPNKYKSPYIDHFSWLSLNGNIDEVSRELDRLMKWCFHNFNYDDPVIRYYLENKDKGGPKFDPLCKLYSDWLQDCPWDRSWLSQNTNQIFNYWGSAFKEFLSHLESKYHIEPIERK